MAAGADALEGGTAADKAGAGRKTDIFTAKWPEGDFSASVEMTNNINIHKAAKWLCVFNLAA